MPRLRQVAGRPARFVRDGAYRRFECLRIPRYQSVKRGMQPRSAGARLAL